MMGKTIATAALLLLLITACASRPGSWIWQHPDVDYAREQRTRDIEECERFALDVTMDGPFEAVNARDYGGWGHLDFELCMNGRGWSQTYEGR